MNLFKRRLKRTNGYDGNMITVFDSLQELSMVSGLLRLVLAMLCGELRGRHCRSVDGPAYRAGVFAVGISDAQQSATQWRERRKADGGAAQRGEYSQGNG